MSMVVDTPAIDPVSLLRVKVLDHFKNSLEPSTLTYLDDPGTHSKSLLSPHTRRIHLFSHSLSLFSFSSFSSLFSLFLFLFLFDFSPVVLSKFLKKARHDVEAAVEHVRQAVVWREVVKIQSLDKNTRSQLFSVHKTDLKQQPVV